MKHKLKPLFLALFLAAPFCAPAYAAQAGPGPVPDQPEDCGGIFQSGAASGPQTIPGQPELMEDWQKELEQYLTAAWKGGWKLLQDRQLSEDSVFFLDISDFNIYYPYRADENNVEIQQQKEAFHTLMGRVINDDPEAFYYASGWWYKSTGEGTTNDWIQYDPQTRQWRRCEKPGAGTDWIQYDSASQHWKVNHISLTYREFGGLTGEEAETRFQAAVAEAMAQIEGITDPLEKLLVLHDHLVSHTSYNYERSHNLPAPTLRIYGAYGALVDGDSVCNGYTLAYKVLLDRAGIPNVYLATAPDSNNIAHAWNLVQLDGEYYHVDTTWDDGVEGNSSYNFFLLSDETSRERHGEYNRWSDSLPKASSTKYESGWFFNDHAHLLYHDGGKYYTIRNSAKDIFCSDSLHSQGTNINSLDRDVHIYCNAGIVWKDRYLYYIYWDSFGQKRLMAYHLDSGHYIQVGQFGREGSPQGIGLRYEDGRIIPVDCNTNGHLQLDPGIPLLPPQPDAVPVQKKWNDGFPIYYHNEKFYAVNTKRTADGYLEKTSVTASSVLGAEGTNPDPLDRNTQIELYHDAVWLDDYLYYVNWNSKGPEAVMAFHLGSGNIIQAAQTERPAEGRLCIRCSDTGDSITVCHQETEMASIPLLPPQPHAEPARKDLNDYFPVYYYNNKFYTVNTERDSGHYIQKVKVTVSSILGAKGTNPDPLDRNLQMEPYHGVVLLGGYLYYMDWTSEGPETLMAFHLDSGKIIQAAQVECPTEGRLYVQGSSTGDRIIVYCQQELASFPVLPPEAGSGITVVDDGNAAYARAGEGKELWVARYNSDGKMVGIRREDLVQPDTYWFFGELQMDGMVIPLRQGSERVRVFLLDPGFIPDCPAA